MNKVIKKLGIGVITATVAFSAVSASAEVVSNDAAVIIVEPLVVTANDDMDFGKITKPATTGNIVLSSGGAIASTSGVSVAGGTPAAGTVDISGDATQTVSITVTDTTSVAGLTLTSFTSSAFGGQTLSGGTLSTATLTGGTDVLSMGATLGINSQAAGFTTGAKTPTYDVEVSYN